MEAGILQEKAITSSMMNHATKGWGGRLGSTLLLEASRVQSRTTTSSQTSVLISNYGLWIEKRRSRRTRRDEKTADSPMNRLRVRAQNDDSEPLGPGYWDGAEGKARMAEIEDMKELVAEAVNLKREYGEESVSQDERENQARRDAAKFMEQLSERAREQAEKRKNAEKMYQLGQAAYGRGMYDKSVNFFEGALLNVQPSTTLGGEIQVWLAMAYDANNRHADCISLYKRLEVGHPNPKIKRQAAELRYILEAPKLKISREEMVSIPMIERDYDKKQRTYSQKLRDRRRPKPKASQEKDYLEDWLRFELPPRWERNPYFWVAVTVWLTACGIALMFQD